MIEISRSKSWMKRVGSWYSDAWNYLANIQELIQNQEAVISAIRDDQVSEATQLIVYTVKMAEADKEYNQKLPNHTKGFTVQISDGTAFRLSSESGRVGRANRPYWTVPTNTAYDESGLDLMNTTLYFASSTADKTIEIFVKV